MTENYSSGNNKILDKSSTHLRHKNLCSINVKFKIFLKAKSAFSTVTKLPKTKDNLVLFSKYKISKLPSKSSANKSAADHLYGLLTSVVWLLTSVVQTY
jgi:hypothetical protein